MIKKTFNFLRMRFYAYYEVYNETNDLNWKQVNKDYMIKTWKDICECEFVKKQSHVKFDSNETDIKQMKFLINLIDKEQ